MKTPINLRIPGPTPLRPEVLEAVSRPMINHRSPAMASLLGGIREKLSDYLETRADVLLLAASGTAGLEAAVINTLSPGDRVFAVCGGVFGERFAKIAEAYGAEVDRLELTWGKACEPDLLEAQLKGKRYRAILLTHNETSTGVMHPLKKIVPVIRKHSDALILVDAISSLGGVDLDIDGLALDMVVSGSQKAWGAPPGIALMFVGKRSWEAHKSARMPRFYLDLARYRDAADAGGFPNTPATSVLYGLDASLDLMLQEGASKIRAQHEQAAVSTREAGRSLGLGLFADERFASHTVTAFTLPESVNGKELVKRLREDHRIEIGGGQARLAGKIVRVGHLGWIRQVDLDACMTAVGETLADLGHRKT